MKVEKESLSAPSSIQYKKGRRNKTSGSAGCQTDGISDLTHS